MKISSFSFMKTDLKYSSKQTIRPRSRKYEALEGKIETLLLQNQRLSNKLRDNALEAQV